MTPTAYATAAIACLRYALGYQHYVDAIASVRQAKKLAYAAMTSGGISEASQRRVALLIKRVEIKVRGTTGKEARA